MVSLGSHPHSTARKRQSASHFSSFEGQMQQLIINSRSYFELIANGDLASTVNRTVTFARADLPHKFPLTFHTPHSSWLALPKIDAHHILLIQFHLKTSLENGLIMFNKGQNDDFIAIELVGGQILYSFGLNKVREEFKQNNNKKNSQKREN